MTKQYGPEARYSGRFGDHIEPEDGFVYPEPGDEIIALEAYRTSGSRLSYIVQAGDVGTVIENRKPGTFDHVQGYIGLVVHFDRVKGNYPAGFVIFWDKASKPGAFSFRKPPAPAPTQP